MLERKIGTLDKEGDGPWFRENDDIYDGVGRNRVLVSRGTAFLFQEKERSHVAVRIAVDVSSLDVSVTTPILDVVTPAFSGFFNMSPQDVHDLGTVIRKAATDMAASILERRYS